MSDGSPRPRGRQRIYATPEEARRAQATQNRRRRRDAYARGLCLTCKLRERDDPNRVNCEFCRIIKAECRERSRLARQIPAGALALVHRLEGCGWRDLFAIFPVAKSVGPRHDRSGYIVPLRDHGVATPDATAFAMEPP